MVKQAYRLAPYRNRAAKQAFSPGAPTSCYVDFLDLGVTSDETRYRQVTALLPSAPNRRKSAAWGPSFSQPMTHLAQRPTVARNLRGYLRQHATLRNITYT